MLLSGGVGGKGGKRTLDKLYESVVCIQGRKSTYAHINYIYKINWSILLNFQLIGKGYLVFLSFMIIWIRKVNRKSHRVASSIYSYYCCRLRKFASLHVSVASQTTWLSLKLWFHWLCCRNPTAGHNHKNDSSEHIW